MRSSQAAIVVVLLVMMLEGAVNSLHFMELEDEGDYVNQVPHGDSETTLEDIIELRPEAEELSPPVSYGGDQYTVTGTIMDITLKKKGFSYQGIPFGEPPEGNLRFMPPVKKAPFGSINTTYQAKSCPQSGILKSTTEDCLYLDVYTPILPNSTYNPKMPVMFFIYGGAFTQGGSQLYFPNRLQAKHDVVVITTQYRLGVISFFTTMTDDAPGNLALYDQVLALEWVRDNIEAFGGDPGKVTIFGESAGGASVSLLLVSPLASGLFHRAIAESGSSLVDWAYNEDPITTTRQMADMAGCPFDVPPADLVDCMRQLSVSELVDLGDTFAKNERLVARNGFDGLNPVIQPDTLTIPRVLPEDPLVLLETGRINKVPTIHGVNKNEGSFVFGLMYNQYLIPNNLVNDTEFLKNECVNVMLKAFHVMDPTDGVANSIEAKYFQYVGDNWDVDTMYPGLEDLTGLFGMKSGAKKVSELLAENGVDSYTYSFQYRGRHSMSFFLFFGEWIPFDTGVTHADELIYLFPIPLMSIMNDEEQAVSDNMVQMWVDFATHGDPTPPSSPLLIRGEGTRWPPVSENNAYLEITTDLTVKHDIAQTFDIAVNEYINSTMTTVAPQTTTPSDLSTTTTESSCKRNLDDMTGERDTFRGTTIGLAVAAVLIVVVGILVIARVRRSKPGRISDVPT